MLKNIFAFILGQMLVVNAFAACSGKDAGLSRESVIQDLQQLETEFKNKYALYDLKKDIFESELKKIRDGLQPENCTSSVVLSLAKMLAQLEDGHTSIDSFDKYFEKKYLPFQISRIPNKMEYRYVAYTFTAEKKRFLKERFPFVTHLDGVPIQDWIDTASQYRLAGRKYVSEKFGLSKAKNVGFMRKVLNLPKNDTIKVGLFDGRKTAEVNLKLSEIAEKLPPLPFNRSKLYEKDNIGYLRIYDMATFDELLEYDLFYEKNLISEYMMQDSTTLAIHYMMEKFKTTRALIIDIRGNPGGSRNIIQALLPYLLKEAAPLVYNISAYRVKDPGDHPKIRFSKPLAKNQFHPNVSKDVMDGFRSYYFTSASTMDRSSNIFHYNHPVVVLMDDSDYSAADNLANALSQIEGIITVGTETAGGSGGPQSVSLKNSEIKIKYSFMASFKPSGELYNDRGTVPQHIIDPDPEFFIGKSDPVLDYALTYLKQSYLKP